MRLTGRKVTAAVLAAASIGLGGGGTARASHFSCGPGVPVFQPGIGGVEVATDTNTGWQGICLTIYNGNHDTIGFLSAKYIIEESSPVAPTGLLVRAGFCTDPSGDCSAQIQRTGFEVVFPLPCDEEPGILLCGEATAWVNDDPGDPDEEIDRTGIRIYPGDGLGSDRIDIGSLFVYYDGERLIEDGIPLCLRTMPLGASC